MVTIEVINFSSLVLNPLLYSSSTIGSSQNLASLLSFRTCICILFSSFEKIQNEAKEIRKQFETKAVVELTKMTPNLAIKNATHIVKQAIAHDALYGQFPITLENGEQITVQDIIDEPQKYHMTPCADPLDKSVFGKSMIYSNQYNPVIHTFANGDCTYKLHSNIADWEVNLNDHVYELNKTYAQVLIGGKHKLMRAVPKEVHPDSRVSYEFISMNELKKLYINDLIPVDHKFDGKNNTYIMTDKLSAWASHEECRIYQGGVVFRPAITMPTDYYNTWQGFAIEPKANKSTSLINDHINNIICAGDSALIEYFYNWIAYTMQQPDQPAGTALILRGNKGTGKGTIGHFLRKIWGAHAKHISNSSHLVGKFNAHLAEVCFLFADEAFFSGDKQHEGVLKALITEPTIMIERKGIDAIDQPNYLKVFMVTNNEFAVPASKDERR